MNTHTVCPTLSTIPHGFFTRRGGVSRGIYRSLNCGPGSSDDPENVAENRRIAATAISARRDTPLLSLYQIHSDKAVIASSNWGDDRPKADAMVTNRPGLILGILTADCTPVLFADEKAGVIGAAHAGWKGALSGVLENTVTLMETLGAKRANITAAIGPTIHQKSYEVDTEFQDRFTATDPTYSQFFASGADENHLQFGLPEFVMHQLSKAGLPAPWHANIDTYTSQDHFSYRRTTHAQEPDYGRQLSAIMLTR